MAVDYEGTAPAQPLGINVPYCYTYAHTVYPLKCVFGPAIPNNHGTAAPFTVAAPEGSILNPAFPAAVSARHLTGQFLSAAVLLALAEALPDRVIAESGVPRPQVVFSGATAPGARFVEHLFVSSGVGAGSGTDGPHALCYPTNTSNTPVEILESLTPLVVERKEIRAGSGGAGARRGGCGQVFVVRNGGEAPIRLSVLADLTHRGARGLAGGEDGAPAAFAVDGRPIADKAVLDLPPGSVLRIDAAGGGGFGPPARPPRPARRRRPRGRVPGTHRHGRDLRRSHLLPRRSAAALPASHSSRRAEEPPLRGPSASWPTRSGSLGGARILPPKVITHRIAPDATALSWECIVRLGAVRIFSYQGVNGMSHESPVRHVHQAPGELFERESVIFPYGAVYPNPDGAGRDL